MPAKTVSAPDHIKRERIKDWFSLNMGDLVQVGSNVGVIKEIGEEFTRIELENGEYVIPHVCIKDALRHIRFRLI